MISAIDERFFKREFKIGDIVRRRRWSDTTSDWICTDEPPHVIIDIIRVYDSKEDASKDASRCDLKLMDYTGQIRVYPSVIFVSAA